MSQKQSGDLYRVVHKEGTHLASSKATEGAFRGALLDDRDRLAGQAEFVKVDEDSEYEYNEPYEYKETHEDVELSDEAKEIAQFLGKAAAAAIIALVTAATPHLKHWWKDIAAPNLKKNWHGITGKKKAKQSKKDKNNSQIHTTEIATTSGTVPGMLSKELDDAYEKYKINISSAEAQKELIDIAILSAILAAKIRKLSNVCIRESGGMPEDYLEWQQVIEKLTAQKVTESINLILENNISLLDEKSSMSLSDILGRSLISNGLYVPIENDRFKEALTLKIDAYDEKR